MTHISDNSNANNGGSTGGPAPRSNGSRRSFFRLHRLREVRRQEGISRRTVAQHLGVTVGEVKRQESMQADLPLSVLFEWQRVLKVPLPDLLEPPTDFLSPPVMQKAQLIQLMKSAVTIADQSAQKAMRRLAQQIVDQLAEMMPELREVGPLPANGQQRGPEDYGRVAEQPVSDHRLT